MPNYEYQCTACDHIFELWQPVGEAAPACPECGSPVKKIFHAPRVIFKGSGFYVTDLRAEKAASSGSSSGRAAAAKDTTANESAPTADSSPTEKAASVKSESGSSTASSAPSADKPTPA